MTGTSGVSLVVQMPDGEVMINAADRSIAELAARRLVRVNP